MSLIDFLANIKDIFTVAGILLIGFSIYLGKGEKLPWQNTILSKRIFQTGFVISVAAQVLGAVLRYIQ